MKIKFRYIFKRKEDGLIWTNIVPIECLELAGDQPFIHVLNTIKIGKNKTWEFLSRDLFTGFYDKNDKEIYDKDIVEWENELSGKTVREAIFYKESSGAWVTESGLLFEFRVPNLTVIGNKFETPELIE